MLSDPDSFAKGARVRIFEAGDCENCETRKSSPIIENENIIAIYDAMLERYDGFSGTKVIGTMDVIAVMEMLEVPEEIQDDYYARIAYYHSEVMRASVKGSKKKKEHDEDAEAWKKRRRAELRG